MNITLSEEYIKAAKELELDIARLINAFEDKYKPLQVQEWEMDRYELSSEFTTQPKFSAVRVDIDLTIG